MAVALNHTIVASKDKAAGSRWLAELLGLPSPTEFGPFMVVELAHGLSLDFATTDREIQPQHYAFLITEDEFDQIFGRIKEQGLGFWADPFQSHPGEINTNDGGRGVYFLSDDGHILEILTRPYGCGS
jgi:hypothetical protein